MKETSKYNDIIVKELNTFYNSSEFSFTLLFNKLYQYKYFDYTEDYSSFDSFKREQSNIYFNKAITDFKKTRSSELKKEITEIATRELYKRYDILIQLNDFETFKYVLKKAENFLKGDDYLDSVGDKYESGDVIFDLLKAYYNADFRASVIEFINQAFNFAKTYAFENKKWDYLSGDPDGTTLLVLAQAITSLNKEDREQFSDIIFDIYEFCSLETRSYELNQTSGHIALLLMHYDKNINIEILNNAIEITGEHYQNNTFVHQTRYSKWVMTNDAQGALSFLTDQENGKGFTFAIIALADLNYKKALPILKSMLKEEQDPVFIEVLQEAILRLNNQDSIPKVEERMIWLNGNLTPTQRALGAESNNIFIKRAQQKKELDDNVYETDDD